MSLLAIVQKIESALNSKEMKAFAKQANALVHKLHQIDSQKAEEHFKTNADISESILAELDRKQIDSLVLDGIRFPEGVELYVLSIQGNCLKIVWIFLKKWTITLLKPISAY
ncbi:MAG: hypothetical protein HEQ32_02340 [Vampirovibrio sp.]